MLSLIGEFSVKMPLAISLYRDGFIKWVIEVDQPLPLVKMNTKYPGHVFRLLFSRELPGIFGQRFRYDLHRQTETE